MKRDGDDESLAATDVGQGTPPPPTATGQRVHPRASTPLAETLPGEVAAPALDRTAVDSLSGRKSFDIGTQVKIDRFIVLAKLGEGGMGLVLAAYDPELDRKVAIKMLHDHVSSTQGDRLVREARAMAQLSHPNVVTVHETGTFGERLYIAMEYVEGQTLGAWLRAAPRTRDEILGLLLQAGRGLAAAHAAGLVHRDFKPDNVLVGKDGRVRVSDFGLVSSSGEASPTVDGKAPAARPSALTMTGSVMGTPLYMAPEQHDGRVADAKADQFSYCVTLWQALCDELPYGADTYEDLRANVTGGKLRAIPRGARVSNKLRAILARGLSAAPIDRFPSMQALLDAMDRARRPLRWPILVAGGAILAGGGVAVALAVSGGKADPCAGSELRLAGIWDGARKAKVGDGFAKADGADTWPQIAASVDRYTARWVEHHRDVCRATHDRGEQSAELLDLRMHCMDERLAGVDALLARFGEVSTRDGVLKAIDATAALPGFGDCDDLARLRAAVALPADPDRRAKIVELERRFAEVVSFDKVGNYTHARALVTPMLGAVQLVEYAPLEAEVVLERAGLEYRSGDFAAAAESYRAAAAAAARARDDVRIAQSWIDLLNLLSAQGKYADALALETIARTSTERVSDQPRLVARFSNALGGVYLAQGRYQEAKVEYQKALDNVRKDRPDSDLLGPALANVGMSLWYVGDRGAAKRYLEDARDAFIATLGPTHPSLGYVHRNLGDYALQANDLDGALGHYLDAERIFTAAHGPDHIDVALALDQECYVYARKHDIAKARAIGQRSLAIREAKVGKEHISLVNTLTNLSDAEAADGTPAGLDRAAAELDRALAIEEQTYGKVHPTMPDTLDRIGMLAKRRGRAAEGLAALERSLAIRTKVLGPHANDTAYSEMRLAEVEAAAGKLDAAVADFGVAEQVFHNNDPKDSDAGRARFGRGAALYAAGKHSEGLAVVRSARDFVVALPDTKELVDMIDAWLAAPGK